MPTPDQLREYAATLLLEHAHSIEYLSIFEMAEEHLDGADEISDEDAKTVDELMSKATITISWPGCGPGWVHKGKED